MVQVVPGQVHFALIRGYARGGDSSAGDGKFCGGRADRQGGGEPAESRLPGRSIMWNWWTRPPPIPWMCREHDQATFVTNAYVPDPLVQVVQPAPVRVTVIMENAAERGHEADV